MAKVPMIPFHLLSRRWYKVAAEGNSTARLKQAVSTMQRTTATESSGGSNTVADVKEKEQVPWMRNPKTGCWAPENHSADVDVAEQREKLLNKHKV